MASKTTTKVTKPDRPETLGDMGEVWQKNLDTLLNRDNPADIRLDALHAIDRLFDGPLTPAEDLESVVAEMEENLDTRRPY